MTWIIRFGSMGHLDARAAVCKGLRSTSCDTSRIILLGAAAPEAADIPQLAPTLCRMGSRLATRVTVRCKDLSQNEEQLFRIV
jgi:hypothetical protein